MKPRDVFALGFRDGAKDGRPISARLAGRRYPRLTQEELAVYLNGHDDGIVGDRFRLDLGHGRAA